MAATAVRLVVLFALVTRLAVAAEPQTGGLSYPANDPVTIDASQLNAVIAVDALWRFSSADDPRFSSPTFDDAAWTLIQPKEGQSLVGAHSPDVPDGRCWARLHLRLVNGKAPLAFSLGVRNHVQYEVFVNGNKVSESRGFAAGISQNELPSPIMLPQSSELLVAIHFVYPGGPVLHYFPLELLEIGQSETLGNHDDLQSSHEFKKYWLFNVFVALDIFALVPFSLALFFSQRDHSEYLWFAVSLLFIATELCYLAATTWGWMSAGDWAHWIFIFLNAGYAFLDAGVVIACCEFVAAFASVRDRRVLRLFQGLVLLVATLSVFKIFANLFDSLQPFEAFAWLLLAGYFLIAAYRKGSMESGLLLVPLLFLPAAPLLTLLSETFPKLAGPLTELHVGDVGIPLFALAELLFVAGVLAVVLFRFIRISREEESKAAELESARKVQQLLIPSAILSPPGFSIESFYLPARQVGGDFFLLLPAPESSNDRSLLAIIGDVSGKGLQAAMVVSTIIGGLRMQLTREPSQVLAHLNRMLAGYIQGFATCCVVLIHQDGRMRVANAGNPSPYCNGEELATLPGLPLGVIPGMLYDETEHILPAGGCLTFVSDGVIEATNSATKELFGFDRVKAISDRSATAIAEAAISFGSGAPQADDITVLTISCNLV